MSWSLSRWAWKLEAPLSVGLPPSGSLNRCRPYVPARNLWGALTAELARRQTMGFPAYAKVGEDVLKDMRLTYLFPAEEANGSWRTWLPRYENAKGLIWQREHDANGNNPVSDRELRSRLLLARPGTAIDEASATAAEGTLHETECIGQHWRDSATDEAKSVALVGYVFVRSGTDLAAGLEQIDVLSIGGDTRYGLGRLRRVFWDQASNVFGDAVDLAGQEPSLWADRVLGHAQSSADKAMVGQLEALSGWDRARGSSLQPLTPAPLWVPGSVVAEKTLWYVRESGIWTRG